LRGEWAVDMEDRQTGIVNRLLAYNSWDVSWEDSTQIKQTNIRVV